MRGYTKGSRALKVNTRARYFSKSKKLIIVLQVKGIQDIFISLAKESI